MKNELLPYVCKKSFEDCNCSESENMLGNIILAMRKSNVLAEFYIIDHCAESYDNIVKKFYNEINNFIYENKIPEKFPLFQCFQLFAKYKHCLPSPGNILHETKSVIPHTLLQYITLEDMENLKYTIVNYRDLKQCCNEILKFFEVPYYEIINSYKNTLHDCSRNSTSLYEYYFENYIKTSYVIHLENCFEDVVTNESNDTNDPSTKINKKDLDEEHKYFTENITKRELISITSEILDLTIKMCSQLHETIKIKDTYVVPIEAIAPVSQLHNKFYTCPKCHHNSIVEFANFCWQCGLKIDWHNHKNAN